MYVINVGSVHDGCDMCRWCNGVRVVFTILGICVCILWHCQKTELANMNLCGWCRCCIRRSVCIWVFWYVWVYDDVCGDGVGWQVWVDTRRWIGG